MTTRLFTAVEVARDLGVSRQWVYQHRSRDPGLEAEFSVVGRGGKPVLLWTRKGLARWREHHVDFNRRSDPYSCLLAVNHVGRNEVSWKLWWQNLPDGKTRWWFSTPAGWHTSVDDGRHWTNTNMMRLSSDYKYFAVNPVDFHSSVAGVLRSCYRLRQELCKERAPV